ncbi:MAG: TlpA disulfide reductase family protein [Actinomycetota bacterium]
MTQKASAPTDSGPNRLFLLAIGALVVVGLAVVAIVAGSRGDDGDVAAGSGDAGSGGDVVLDGQETADIAVAGDALPPLPEGVRIADATNDPAYGLAAPTLSGTGFDGGEVVIEDDGRPKAIYFLAHWCPHCQAEVPTIQELIDEGKLPADLDVYAVSTAVDRGRGNYPPSSWLQDEGFTPTVIRDDDAVSALAAYGASSFPFAVYVNQDNQVVARTAGSMEKGQLEQLWQATATAP